MYGPDFKSKRTAEFKSQFAALPDKVRRSAEQRYVNYFCQDPSHALLRRHTLHNVSDAQAASIAVEIYYGYRAVAFHAAAERTYVWYWCGSHADYDARFRKGR